MVKVNTAGLDRRMCEQSRYTPDAPQYPTEATMP